MFHKARTDLRVPVQGRKCVSGVLLPPQDMVLGLYWDNGKENGNYYSILELYRHNGK